MPYKDPERKRRWEQAHRQRRTQQRKMQRARQRSLQMHDNSASAPKKSKGAWWVVLLGVAAAFVALAISQDAAP